MQLKSPWGLATLRDLAAASDLDNDGRLFRADGRHPRPDRRGRPPRQGAGDHPREVGQPADRSTPPAAPIPACSSSACQDFRISADQASFEAAGDGRRRPHRLIQFRLAQPLSQHGDDAARRRSGIRADDAPLFRARAGQFAGDHAGGVQGARDLAAAPQVADLLVPGGVARLHRHPAPSRCAVP